jgi:hypothetical protein
MAVDAAPRDDFRQKLVLSVVDKLVLGGLIVLAGFVLNLVLENHRADQAMKTEIARLRVEKVAEIWQALDRHQRAVTSVGQYEVRKSSVYVRAVAAPPDREISLLADVIATDAIRKTRYALLLKENARLTALIETNRFWIGERLYPKYVNYKARQNKLLNAYKDLQVGLTRLLLSTEGNFSAEGRASLLTKLRAARSRVLRNVEERLRELNESRTDVFSAMESLS